MASSDSHSSVARSDEYNNGYVLEEEESAIRRFFFQKKINQKSLYFYKKIQLKKFSLKNHP